MQLQCALTTEPSLSITNHGFKPESFIRKTSNAKAKISYRDSLDTITKARYVDKLKEIDGKDPYEMENEGVQRPF
jgi:hypothetical protein